MKKVYTKEELDAAYEQGGTYSGAARILGCDPKTFKKYWLQSQEQETSHEPLYSLSSDSFVDQEVERIVNEHRSNKVNNSTYAIIIEMTDQIDTDKRRIEMIKERIEKFERYLKNMKL